MRDIKAPRAWYKPLGIMIQPDKVESINFDTKTIGVYMEMDGKGFHRLRLTDFILMWPTHLKDRNGKEIYERDIIESTRGYRAVVEWVDDGRFLGRTKDRSIVYVGQEPAVTVIGNIHDNPELLTGGKADE